MTIPRGAVLWGVTALVAFTCGLIALLLSGEESRRLSESEAEPSVRTSQNHYTSSYSDTATRLAVESFANQNNPQSGGDEKNEVALVPEEWEQPLFDILMDQTQGIERRNERLLELATGPAKGVPAVQKECVMHLLFGLSDNDGAQFLAVTTNAAIPAEMRAGFLKEALAMRPTELGEWLSQQVSNHHEPDISAIGRLYLLEIKEAPR